MGEIGEYQPKPPITPQTPRNEPVRQPVLIDGEKYEQGQLVPIRRTTGQIENWVLVGAFGSNIRVAGTGVNGETLIKNIPRSEFLSIQRKTNPELMKKGIKSMIEHFKQLSTQGVVKKAENWLIDDFLWQHVVYGKETIAGSEGRFRGYLMIEPEDFPAALGLLSQVAYERLKQGRPTEFKWLTKIGIDEEGVGQYPGLQPEDPRVALYADKIEDILEILQELTKKPEWRAIEQNRNLSNNGRAPRRPGTNALIDERGIEWRSLNYNNFTGVSESQAVDPKWRGYKIGTSTQRISNLR